MCRLFEIYLAGCSGCGIFQLVEAQFVILSVSVFIFFHNLISAYFLVMIFMLNYFGFVF
jgi:hypothetical protein